MMCLNRMPIKLISLALLLALAGQRASGDGARDRDPTNSALAPAVKVPPLAPLGDATDTEKAANPPESAPTILLVKATEAAYPIPTIALIDQKQKQVAAQLRLAMHQQQATGTAEQGPKTEDSKVDLLKQIDVIVAQQKSATTSLADLEQKKAELETSLTQLTDRPMEGGPPFSILLLDQLRDDRRDSKTRLETAEASLLTARQAIEQAKETADQQARNLRQLKERLGSDAETPELEVAQLQVNLANEILVLRRQELQIAKANQEILSLQVESIEQKTEIIGPQVEFSPEMLAEKLAEIDARESELKRRLSSLQSELQFAERRWMTARQEVDSTPDPGSPLRARVDALKTIEQSVQTEIDLINQRLGRLPMLRNAWERRFHVATGTVSGDDRREWLRETKEKQDQLVRERRSHELKLDELRVSRAAVASKLEQVNDDNPEVKRWEQQVYDALNKQIEVLGSSLVAIDLSTRVLDRLRLQIEGDRGRSFAEFASDLWASAKKIWNLELANVDETSVTVGKVISSVLLMFFGFFGARWFSRMLGKRMPQMGVDEAAVQTIESLSFYILLVTFALTALKYVSVPLTVFTFLGGAIAIGVGFGSQNVVNNFISGLILLAERPIKAGDLIKIGETYGNVTKIGARSTQIRTGENQDITVPNSTFLENEVTNLTRRDDRLRTSITVGVAYGTSPELVMELLERTATEQPGVNERPKPIVWFNDFGDNSLVFQVHFWINARTLTQMRAIETRVRLGIARSFREHDIVIAFPQRDLHIQSPRPIDFRLVDDSRGLASNDLKSAG